MNSINSNPLGLVPANEAAQHLGITPATLADMRKRGDGPPFVRPTPHRTFYKLSDLQEFLDGRRYVSLKDEARARRVVKRQPAPVEATA